MQKLSNIPYELLLEIAKRLKKLEDFTCLRSVSRSLHLSVEGEYFEGLRFRKSLPYLMLPPDSRDGICQFYSLVEGESIVASLGIPTFKTITKMCYESLGWLLTVDVDGSMSLLEPFSNTEIPVPHLHTFPGLERFHHKGKFIRKMVLSSRPNETSDFTMLVLIRAHLAFWRLGDKEWNKIYEQRGLFLDIVYGGGKQFYAISSPGFVWVINIIAGYVEDPIIIYHVPGLFVHLGQGQYILKSIDGSLLGITRTRDPKFCLTSIFQVYDIDIVTGRWKEIYSLGNTAIFLGRNSSIAVDATASASNGGVIKANHIYFTDDWAWRGHYGHSRYAKGGSVDSGVFNFKTGDIEPVYPVAPLTSNVSPAMWITPNLSF